MNLKRLLTLTLATTGLALAAVAAGPAPAAAPAAPPKPAILLDTWGGVPDLDYMKRLQAAGFEMDAIGHHELTWERLRNYNVLLLVDFPQEGKVTLDPHGSVGGANGHLPYLQPIATDLNPALPPPAVKLHKGIVGPRTAYSGGQGTVAEYAAVAREKGLSFIMFLEDLANLTPEKLAKLRDDCKANSGDDLLLL